MPIAEDRISTRVLKDQVISSAGIVQAVQPGLH